MPFDSDTPSDECLPLWSFRDDVVIESAPDGRHLVILTRWGDVTVDSAAPAIRDCLYRMTLGPVALTNVAGLDLAELEALFARLPGCVVRSLGLHNGAAPLLSAIPITQHEVLTLACPDPAQPVRLSRFAFIRESGGELRLESPLSHHRVLLHRPLATRVAGALGHTTTCTEIARESNVSATVAAEIIAYLVATGMVLVGDHDANGQPRFAEDADPDLLSWSPYDLLFHSRSRLGRHDDPAGAAFRHANRLPPLPAVKPPPDGPRFPLHQPDLADSPANDMPLSAAIERRHSVREFADEGPTARQLGELLYRAARVRTQTETTGAGGVRYPVSTRPYPSAGSLYEIDLYLTVDRCDGLPRGIYHYDPADHALTLVDDKPAHLDELLNGAMVVIGTHRWPPALITMTTRIGRLSWVYDSIGYATTLKHVGVLQQTLYLVATMLGLASCALAVGDGEVATAAFGLDWPAEVSVGEFVVGLPRQGPQDHQIHGGR